MPNQKTIIRQEYGELAYNHSDMTANLINAQAFPPMGIDDETGLFRVGGNDQYFNEEKMAMSKFTKAREFGQEDSTQNFNLTPAGSAWVFSELDLRKPQKFGASSREEMKMDMVMTRAALAKKQKEKALYTAVLANANYASSSYYADATTDWATIASSVPLTDVQTGLIQVPEANAMIISKLDYRYLQNTAQITGKTTVTGKARNAEMNPTVDVNHLLNVFGLDYIFVASGRFKTDSSVSSSTAKSDIWGRTALLFYYNPDTSDKDGRFIKHLYLAGEGASSDEGWVVTETFDPETGLYGAYRYQLGSYYQFLPHRKELGYRINTAGA